MAILLSIFFVVSRWPALLKWSLVLDHVAILGLSWVLQDYLCQRKPLCLLTLAVLTSSLSAISIASLLQSGMLLNSNDNNTRYYDCVFIARQLQPFSFIIYFLNGFSYTHAMPTSGLSTRPSVMNNALFFFFLL